MPVQCMHDTSGCDQDQRSQSDQRNMIANHMTVEHQCTLCLELGAGPTQWLYRISVAVPQLTVCPAPQWLYYTSRKCPFCGCWAYSVAVPYPQETPVLWVLSPLGGCTTPQGNAHCCGCWGCRLGELRDPADQLRLVTQSAQACERCAARHHSRRGCAATCTHTAATKRGSGGCPGASVTRSRSRTAFCHQGSCRPTAAFCSCRIIS